MDTKLAKVSHLSQVLSCVFSAIMLAIIIWPLVPPEQHRYEVWDTNVIAYWPLALLALCIVGAAGLHLASVLVARRSSAEGEKRVSTVPPARQADTNHEDCQRQIRNLESTVSRLREHETTQGIQISARDTQIEQLQAKLNELKTCPYELVHRIADQEAKVIRDFVSVSRVGVWRHKLQDAVPAIKWGFMIKNDSIFPISLVEVRNNIFFEGVKLAERRFEDSNEVQELPQWRVGWVIFEQRLSSIEAQHIKSTPNGTFRFDGLIITISNPNNFPIIEPQQVEIERDLETTLDKITYKETEGMKRLKDEIASLKQQTEELKAQAPKEGLTFEIDAQRTKVFVTGRSNDSHTYQVNVRLRCSRVGDSKLAVRAFVATLFAASENKDVVFWKQGPVIAYAEPHMDPVDIEKGWTINVPLTDFRWYYFFFDITDTAASILTPRDHFFRVTMDTVGQEPQHIDFFVDSWNDAFKSESGITLRRAIGAHHESA